MTLGISTSHGVSVDLAIVQGSERDGKIDVLLTAFSPSSRWTAISLLYKKDALGEWRDDISVMSSGSRFINKNKMYCIPCSISGEKTYLTWNYAENGIATGSHCIIKVEVSPSATVIGGAEEYSWIETIFGENNSITDGKILGYAVGFDSYGNAIVLEDRSVSVIDIVTQDKLMETGEIIYPRHATGLRNGSIMVIDSNGIIFEYDETGGLVRSFDASSIANGYPLISVSQSTGNVLVSGGSVHQVSEITWGGDDYGTILWSLGGIAPGDEPNRLNTPMGASYGAGEETIAICDYGNNRVLVIDRSIIPQSVTIMSSVMIGDTSTAVLSPAWCTVLGNNVFVCELLGRAEGFSPNPAVHPSMVRSGTTAGSGDNAIPQYAGMCFVPIFRSVK